MKQLCALLLLVICFCACEQDSEPKMKDLVGLWNIETVYFNDVNSDQYADFLNGGNHLELTADNTFLRAYDWGNWSSSGSTLTLHRPSHLRGDWKYTIVSSSRSRLVLEMKLSVPDYCCGFDEFGKDEIVVIREEYSRVR